MSPTFHNDEDGLRRAGDAFAEIERAFERPVRVR